MDRLMAIDYGEKRIGIALSDPLKMFSKPFKVLANSGKNKLIADLNDLVKEQSVSKIILGHPLGESGQETKKTQEIMKIHKLLVNKLDVEVILQDERFTTVDANNELKKLGYNYMEAKKVIDMVAASLILKTYMERL